MQCISRRVEGQAKVLVGKRGSCMPLSVFAGPMGGCLVSCWRHEPAGVVAQCAPPAEIVVPGHTKWLHTRLQTVWRRECSGTHERMHSAQARCNVTARRVPTRRVYQFRTVVAHERADCRPLGGRIAAPTSSTRSRQSIIAHTTQRRSHALARAPRRRKLPHRPH